MGNADRLSTPGMADEISRLGPWFHNLHLPGGMQTAPHHELGDFPAVKWRQVAPFLPADLSGLEVLDIGCNAGFYSFELARRGGQVTGIDVDGRYLRQARWAAAVLGLEHRVLFREQSVYELARAGVQFDLVWFMGVLYHLRHPLLALDVVREISAGLMVLQTLTMPGERVAEVPPDMALMDREALAGPGWPRMAFIERCMARDPTNWWAPNHACVEAMLRSSGFRVVARPAHEIYLCRCLPEGAAGDARRDELRQVFGTLPEKGGG